jgi:hypothetical protein
MCAEASTVLRAVVEGFFFNHELGTCFYVHKRIISAAKMVEFVNERMSYIVLRSCWCHCSERSCPSRR